MPMIGIYFALDKSLSIAALPHFGLPDGEGIPFTCLYDLAFLQHLPYFLRGFVYKFRKAEKRNNRGKPGKLG